MKTFTCGKHAQRAASHPLACDLDRSLLSNPHSKDKHNETRQTALRAAELMNMHLAQRRISCGTRPCTKGTSFLASEFGVSVGQTGHSSFVSLLFDLLFGCTRLPCFVGDILAKPFRHRLSSNVQQQTILVSRARRAMFRTNEAVLMSTFDRSRTNQRRRLSTQMRVLL